MTTEPKLISKKRKDFRVASESFENVELTDPVTGKKAIHNVKITRYKPIGGKPVGNKGSGTIDEDIDLEVGIEILDLEVEDED